MRPSETSSEPTSRRRIRKRRLLLLAFTMTVLVLAGWWWVSRPKTYRLLGRYPLVDKPTEIIRPTAAGFLTQESENLYVMRDWATGKERWRAVAKAADYRGWPVANGRPPAAGISPDGQNLYVATPVRDRFLVQFWHAGQFMGDIPIPLPDDVRQAKPGTAANLTPFVFVCDGTRSFLEIGIHQRPKTHRCYLYALNGIQVEATDVAANTAWFSADGQTVSFHHFKTSGPC